MKEFLLRNIKKIIILLLIIILIIAAIIFVIIKNNNKNKYEEIIPEFFEAINSEKNMKEFYKNNINFKGVVAWQEANENSKEFKKTYKKVKKDSEEIDNAEDALLDITDSNRYIGKTKIKVKNIGKVKVDKNNKKIYKVPVKAEIKYEYGSYQSDFVFVFYNNKIIDIVADGTSVFAKIID